MTDLSGLSSRAQPRKGVLICSHPEKEGTAKTWPKKYCIQKGPRSPV